MKKINHRKNDHIRICLEEEVESGSTGFESVKLRGETLPEIDFNEINTSVTLFGRNLEIPVIIEALTGGTAQAKKINGSLASVAQKMGLGFGVGSQRAALEDSAYTDTFQVRDVAPDILLIANLGAIQLNYGYGVSELKKAVDMIGADALALHVNPLQEVMQSEGNKNFKGLASKINSVSKKLDVPVILKEVGCGITLEAAEKISVSAFDVGGVGGTSWALIEGYRAGTVEVGNTFSSWGTSTAESIIHLALLGKPVIGSGGVRTGLDAAKAIALGATCVGLALPVLKAWDEGGAGAVQAVIEKIAYELKIAMFLTGSQTLEELKGKATHPSF